MPDTSSSRRGAMFHGRLNLEQQRKRAKELLRDLRRHDDAAIARAARHLDRHDRPLRLADAQFVVARECGFASWPRLKAHIDAIEFARDHAAQAGDRDMPTLHIRCGSDIRHALDVAGFNGEFLEFSDPFCIGPVPEGPTESLIHRRARFLASAFDLHERDALARQRKAYDALTSLDRYDRVVLWFEHDTYDQLILAYLLHRLRRQRPRSRLELVAVDDVPGVERFVGIGQLSPDLLAWLWTRRRPVDEALLELGERAWAAIAAPSPESLATLAATDTPALPMLGRALRRHLRELPDVRSGLGLSERLTLETVRDLGPLPVGEVFAQLMREREPLPYLGDLMFWWLIQPLITAERPALRVADDSLAWPQRELALTALGRELLAGRERWVEHMPASRWVGGVEVRPGRANWYIDASGDVVWLDATPPPDGR